MSRRPPAPLRRALLAVLLLAGPAAVAPAAWGAPPPGNPAMAKEATDRLLDDLKVAADAQAAAQLEANILNIWLDATSPAARLLVTRGLRDLQAGADAEAVADFDALVALEPDLAESYHERAAARFAAGNSDGAIADIEQTLRREPRHFAAFALLSRIAEKRGNWRGAYEAWQRVLAIDPKTPHGEERLKTLRQKALGQEL